MSAIEMMDPKMDAGMIGNQVNRKVLNFEQAIKVQYHSTKTQTHKNDIATLSLPVVFACLIVTLNSALLLYCALIFISGRCHQG